MDRGTNVVFRLVTCSYRKLEKENMDLRTSYQKLVTKVTDLENEKAEMQSELDQMRLLAKYKKTDFKTERDELQSEISELQMLVEDLRTQVGNSTKDLEMIDQFSTRVFLTVLSTWEHLDITKCWGMSL